MKLSNLKSDPRVYLGLGIVGMLTGTVLASKATPKAVDILEKKKVVLKKKSKDEVTVIEAAKKTWKLYLPATLMCTASIACLIGSDVLHEKRNTALLAAYQLSSTALAEYKNSVIDTVGEKKEREIKDNLAQKQVSEQHNNKECVIETGRGNSLCYEPWCGRFFRTNIDDLRQAEVTINSRVLTDGYASMNDFTGEIGLKDNDVGNVIGWNSNDGLPFDKDLSFTSCLSPWDEACTVISYDIDPYNGYDCPF